MIHQETSDLAAITGVHVFVCVSGRALVCVCVCIVVNFEQLRRGRGQYKNKASSLKLAEACTRGHEWVKRGTK